MFLVYRYYNTATGRSYIGITKNLEKRKKQHKYGIYKNSLLFKALKKYGSESFIIEVLSEAKTRKEIYNLEKEFIEKYNSYKNGYNMTEGGEGLFALCGEDSPASILTEEQAQSIIDDPESHSDVARKYGINCVTVHNIRTGKNWGHLDKTKAPEYKSSREKLTEDIVRKIIFDSCPHYIAAEKYEITSANVRFIRSGKSWKHISRDGAPEYEGGREKPNIDRKQARRKGTTRYFTGKPCKRGHVSERYVSDGACIVCAKEKSKIWRKKERTEYNEYHREYSGRRLHLVEKYLRDPEEMWFERRTRQRAALKQATPPWAEVEEIRRIYAECVRLSRMIRMDFEVSHVVPLKGKKVCGLHTAENLKVVSHNYSDTIKNRFNYNRFAKDMMVWLKQRGL